MRPPRAGRGDGFTLLEVLVATTVLVLIMALLMQVIGQTSATLRQVNAKIDAFQSARAAFEELNETLSQATLNTYWDYRYDPNDPSGVPISYGRSSDLHFRIINQADPDAGLYFQAPLANATNPAETASGLLNACGYFIGFGDDASFRPKHIAESRSRFRLMQAIQPTEGLEVMKTSDSTWITGSSGVRSVARPVADNVIALIVWPKLSAGEDATGQQLSEDFSYDSRASSGIQRAQLPPVVQLSLIAIDESDARRMGGTLQTKIASILDGKFSSIPKFSEDLARVESDLVAEGIKYQVFSSAVALRESKWSK